MHYNCFLAQVWNLLFPQAVYAQKRGLELNLTSIGPACITGISECPRYRYNARRSREIFQIWAAVYGPARRGRLRFVLSTFTISPEASKEMLAFEDTFRWVDHLGITGYLTSSTPINSNWAIMNVKQVSTQLQSARTCRRRFSVLFMTRNKLFMTRNKLTLGQSFGQDKSHGACSSCVEPDDTEPATVRPVAIWISAWGEWVSGWVGVGRGAGGEYGGRCSTRSTLACRRQ